MRLSTAECAAVASAAAASGLATAAWIGRLAMDAAEHRAAPVPAVYRAMLGELLRANAQLERALSVLAPEGPPSGEAAAACMAAARQADAAARRIERMMPQ